MFLLRLGSNSPTRALILKNFGIDFVQNGGNFDEDSIKLLIQNHFVMKLLKQIQRTLQ